MTLPPNCKSLFWYKALNIMNIIKDLPDIKTTKPEIEHVVKEKLEYTLLGTFAITKGLQLFAYNSQKSEVRKVTIKKGDFIQCELTTEGWIWFDPENYNTTIDSKEIYFEALNLSTAIKRIQKFKEGKIKELFNLRKPTNNKIDIFKPL